jgi:hypothetical protein
MIGISPWRAIRPSLPLGGHSQPAARAIDRSVPVGMSPRWFGTGTLSWPGLTKTTCEPPARPLRPSSRCNLTRRHVCREPPRGQSRQPVLGERHDRTKSLACASIQVRLKTAIADFVPSPRSSASNSALGRARSTNPRLELRVAVLRFVTMASGQRRRAASACHKKRASLRLRFRIGDDRGGEQEAFNLSGEAGLHEDGGAERERGTGAWRPSPFCYPEARGEPAALRSSS